MPNHTQGKAKPFLIAFLIPVIVIVAAAAFMAVRNRLHHSLESFNIANYERSSNDLAGNQYSLDVQIDAQLRWDEGFGRMFSVRPLDGSNRLSVFVPDNVGSDIRVGQRFHLNILVKDKGLIQVKALDKF